MIDFHPGETRPVTRSEGIETRHSFSFGSHYDAGNTGFGALVACNEELLAPGGGLGPHHHRDLEVVTWVLEGALAHEDDHGSSGVVRAGQLQVMHAGTGVVHSERNASADAPLRFVQMWLLAGEVGPPSYRLVEVPELRLPNALLRVVTLNESVVLLPNAAFVHAMVTGGSPLVEGVGELEPGDAIRVRDEAVTVSGNGELLVWEMALPRG
jgi:redox-sensitive bicupin YhaK (pirin superfamily)